MKVEDLKLLRHIWQSASFVKAEDCRQSLKLWLIEGNYYVNNPLPDFSLFCQTPDDIKKCFSLDAFHFAMHAAQTVFELERSGAYAKMTSWRVIQTYYAAFFAAHAILRFFGRSFSHLEPGHVKFLVDRCVTEVGVSPNLPSTYYLLSFNHGENNLMFTKYKKSHRDVWKCLLGLLQYISSSALALRATDGRRQELSNFFSDLADALCARGKHPAGNWLSVVRNEVNYKSMHGVWFPFSRSTPSFGDLMGKAANWRVRGGEFRNLDSGQNEMERFFITSFAVIDLALSIGFDYQSLVVNVGRRSENFSRLINQSTAA